MIFFGDSTLAYIAILLTDVYGRKPGFLIITILAIISPIIGSFTMSVPLISIAIMLFFSC